MTKYEYEPYTDTTTQTSNLILPKVPTYIEGFDMQIVQAKDSTGEEVKLISLSTQIYFAKTNPTAKIPTKRTEDAGYDIYACFEQDELKIPPHTTAMIPTGIASACSPDFCFILKERGSTGSKGIGQRCGVIDSGYRSPWFVPVTNTTNQQIIISKKVSETTKDDRTIWYPYSKAICQALVIPVPQTEVKEISYKELQNIKSERGTGSLGSTGK